MKHLMRLLKWLTVGSHPVRVRGLKHLACVRNPHRDGSHPVRVRGLKRLYRKCERLCELVAPRAGAWVETDERKDTIWKILTSHPVRVRGLKQQDVG